MIYLDTGCLVKLYYPEPDSAVIAAVVQGKPIWHTPLHDLELTNALELKGFFKSARLDQIRGARQLVSDDLRNRVRVSFDRDWRGIFAEATRLAQQHTPSIGCRSLDILHCAAAKVVAAEANQNKSAKRGDAITANGFGSEGRILNGSAPRSPAVWRWAIEPIEWYPVAMDRLPSFTVGSHGSETRTGQKLSGRTATFDLAAGAAA